MGDTSSSKIYIHIGLQDIERKVCVGGGGLKILGRAQAYSRILLPERGTE
jgi:hypothetical protein